MKTPRCLFLFVAGSVAAIAQDLQWTEFARRPEFWPAQCTIKVVLKFQGGMTIPAGQKATVVKVTESEIQLTTLDGKTDFAADPDETDALVIARAEYAKLTPKQRAITYDTLIRQKELWPARITLAKSFDLGGGKSVRAGDQLTVMNFEPGKLLVLIEPLKMTMHVTPQVTDVMAQARKLVEDENAAPRFVTEMKAVQAKQLALQERQKALGPVMIELDGKLLNSISGKPQPLESETATKYFVFYRGSSTCSITRQFTPGLIKYYQAMKPSHPEVEFVWMMTESVEDTSKFAKQLGFNWRAIEYESTGSMPMVRKPISGKLPQLIVMDRSGRVLANGWQETAPTALRQLDALLKQPAAGR